MEPVSSNLNFDLKQDRIMLTGCKELLQKERNQDDDLTLKPSEEHSRFEGMSCEMVCGVK